MLWPSRAVANWSIDTASNGPDTDENGRPRKIAMLTNQQVSFFWEHGWLVAPDAVTPNQLSRLTADFDGWVEESRSHAEPWDNATVDGRPRFDMAAGHGPRQPMLRRVNDPIAVSATYLEVMRDSPMVDGVADLIGPNVRFHHSKINSKLPGSATEVKWHQDFAFTPHSNDNVVTALLMVDEVTTDNGPLEVQSGSHTGPIHSIWRDGVFVGAIDPAVEAAAISKADQAIGPAGSVCYMHTRLLHGSAPNKATAPRTLFISVYSADDAVPLSPNPMPTTFSGSMVRGIDRGLIRSIDYAVERPELPATTSFFDQQDTARGEQP